MTTTEESVGNKEMDEIKQDSLKKITDIITSLHDYVKNALVQGS